MKLTGRGGPASYKRPPGCLYNTLVLGEKRDIVQSGKGISNERVSDGYK